MNYNIDFLISSFLFLILLFYHFIISDRLKNQMLNRIFLFFITLGITDIAFDILCTVLIYLENPSLSGLTSLCLTLFYMMQTLVPFSLFLYTASLRENNASLKKLLLHLWPSAILPGVLFLIVLTNFATHLLFQVTDSGVYLHGPIYISMYLYALSYSLLIAIDTFFHRRSYTRKQILTIFEYLIIMGVCVGIQAIASNILLTGFGLGLSITILFFSLNNPAEMRDSFTGFYDIQHFQKWIRKAAESARPFHLVCIDLPQLSQVNKLFGFSVGDGLVNQTVEYLRKTNPHSLIFRIKGRRFVIVAQTLLDYQATRDTAVKLCKKSFTLNDETFLFPASVYGITNAHRFPQPDVLTNYIDYLASLSPSDSENNLIQSDDRTIQNFFYEREVEHFLPIALKEDLFEVYYQPIYSLEEGRFVSMEALSRLRHPSLGPISPEIFITTAERQGLIIQLGILQFKKVCRFLKEHPEVMKTLDNVKYNLSPAELLKEGHCSQFVHIIQDFGLPPSFFQFEITETVATQYSEVLFHEIKTLLDAGIKLCLDDFGSGYANLNVVLKLPFSSIKIDRTLLFDIVEDQKNALFYKSIVDLLRNIGYTVVAEGVEYKPELDLVTQWGVHFVQGYYYSKPLSEALLLSFLSAQKVH